MDSSSFTTASIGGLLNVLKNQCGVAQAFGPTPEAEPPQMVAFDAIWDTGATDSVITQQVVDRCGLAPIGMTKVHGVNGIHDAEVYLVSIFLPNNIVFPAVRVTKGILGGAEILIGMDIINQGDFAVTNYNGVTKFSFRIPSLRHIDFVEEHHRKNNFRVSDRPGSKGPRKKPGKAFGKKKKR